MKIYNINIEISVADKCSDNSLYIKYDHLKDTWESIRDQVSNKLADVKEIQEVLVSIDNVEAKDSQDIYRGLAKIITQEFLKVLRVKDKRNKLKTFRIIVQDQSIYEIFKPTIEGYLKHIQEELGPGPYITTDCIIEMPDGIVIIERSNPPYGFALPGGFVDYGESLEQAVCREAKEETNLELIDLRQFHTYSNP